MFFKCKAPEIQQASALAMSLQFGTDTARKYSITTDEERFFSALEKQLKAAKKSPFYSVTRMANGALSVSSGRAYLGKIKLQGRKTWMQYMANIYDAEIEENRSLEDYIAFLKFWVKVA